jgi:hypothetical protein
MSVSTINTAVAPNRSARDLKFGVFFTMCVKYVQNGDVMGF